MTATYPSYPHKISASYAANWAVADWYIDGTVGVDTNDGISAGTPLKTGAELLRRLSPYAEWPQSVTVHILENGMTDPLILKGNFLNGSSHLDIIGTPTQILDAGTVNTYVGLDHTVPRAPQITLTNVADFTAYRWYRLRLTTTALAGAVAWIAIHNPGGVGVATARISRWTIINQTATNTLFGYSAPVGGEGCVIENLPLVPAIDIQIDGAEALTAGVAQWPLRVCSIQSIDCPLLSLKGRFTVEFPKGIVFGSKIGIVDTSPNTTGTTNGQNAIGCFFAYPNSGSSTLKYGGMPANSGCLFGQGYTSVANIVPVLYGSCLFQGCAPSANISRPISATDLMIYDVGGTAAFFMAGHAIINGMSGNGNAGVGAYIPNGTVLTLSGTQNLQGAVANVQLASTPAINLTIPQALQPNDYAQKGTTAAMTAGTITITVPWYEQTIQKVTVSHAAFAGTPGILSVQQISNTQFTITSSSATDTSTVNWQISPLGRNIFISTN